VVDRRGGPLTVLARRLAAQLLAGEPAPDPVAATERLLAVQGQDARGFRLAIRARTRGGLTVATVEKALTDDRTLLITWLCRGTLHLIRGEDYHWLHALTTPPLFTGNLRRLEQTGVSAGAAEHGVQTIERSLAADGPLTRRQLEERIAAAGIPTRDQALVHLLMLASLRGIAVRGPMIGRQHAYVLVRDWLGPQPPVDRDRALAELARRYLAGHAPAGDRDLAKWAGLPLRDARAGLAAIASELTQRPDGLLELRRGRHDESSPPPRLLGAFDPVLLGWTSREAVTDGQDAALIAGGIFKPFALVGGRAGRGDVADRRARGRGRAVRQDGSPRHGGARPGRCRRDPLPAALRSARAGNPCQMGPPRRFGVDE
jgi:Winged helix DNA-binding domain